jgi:hypothetical protein
MSDIKSIVHIVDPSTKVISAKSAGLIEITMVVYDYIIDKVIFYGTENACKRLERSNFNFIALPL